MSIHNIHILRTVAALLLSVVVASCLQDKFRTGQGEPLPQGKYPLMLTAAVDGMTTRSAGKDAWKYNDAIGVRIYPSDNQEYPVTGKYFLNADGSVRQTEDPVSWPYTEGTVKAWFPYVGKGEVKTMSIADQSGGFEAYDFLAAVAKDEKYTNTVSLRFQHQMAKVTCKLVQGEGISADEFKTVKVSIAGYTQASFSQEGVSGDNNGWITPTSDYEALLVPQDMTGKELIKIELGIKAGVYDTELTEKVLVYTSAEGVANLQGGKHYTYTITVQKDGLVVSSGLSASWVNGGGERSAEEAFSKVYIDNMSDAELRELKFSEDAVEGYPDDKGYHYLKQDATGYYIEVKGYWLTITQTIDEGLPDFSIIPGYTGIDKLVETVEGKDPRKFTFKFYLRSDVIRLTYKCDKKRKPQKGDYYFADGSWSENYIHPSDPNVECIGVVFYSGLYSNGSHFDEITNYADKKLDENKFHGYVVALKDASSEQVVWGPVVDIKDVPYSTSVQDYDGYKTTKLLLPFAKEDEAIALASKYNDEKAPSNSSGWYLPSALQMKEVAIFEKDNKDKLAGSGWESLEKGSGTYYYWSSTGDKDSTKARRVKVGNSPTIPGATSKTNKYYVRAILTF